jgi:hypothetical protein
MALSRLSKSRLVQPWARQAAVTARAAAPPFSLGIRFAIGPCANALSNLVTCTSLATPERLSF